MFKIILIVLLYTHLTFMCYSLYVHRGLAHGSVKFHSVIEHLFRFWLWLTTGVYNRYKIAGHILHHKYADNVNDPHSPHISGKLEMLVYKPIKRIVGFFLPLPQKKFDNNELIAPYVRATPDSGYVFKYATLGPLLFLIFNVVLFGPLGILIYIIFLSFASFMAFTVGDGFSHMFGYRNYQLIDKSYNLIPWGILMSGEELHNNHHARPRSAKLSNHWWEIDIGWIYIKLLMFFRLASLPAAKI